MIFGTFEITLLLILATVMLATFAYTAHKRTDDPLHPAMILAPLFFLGMVLEPAQRLLHPELVDFFPAYQGIAFAMTVQYLGMALLFVGMLSITKKIGTQTSKSSLLDLSLDDAKRSNIRFLAWSLALFALIGYWYGIYQMGGFYKSYSFAKGGAAVSVSGYLGEAQNLGVAAVIFYAISLQGSRITTISVCTALLMMSPTILHATFGGRRGPLFIAGASLFVAYYVAIGRTPKIRHIALMLALLLFGVVFIGSQRENLYFGSGKGLNWERFWTSLLGSKIESADNFVVSSGAVIAIHELNEYHWGRRFFTTFAVRPIPRFIWPTKYDDISNLLYGKNFLDIQNAHYRWLSVLGWRPTNGYAVNSIVDLFWEFSWGYLIALWLFGRGIATAWYRFRTEGGFWFVGYFLITALAIYLPTQSFSAFAHRFLYLSIMSLIFWWLSMGRQERTTELDRLRTRYPNSNIPRPYGSQIRE